MGALADLRTNRKTFKVGSPLDQWAVRQIKRINNDNGAAGDIPVETAAAAADAVWVMATDAVDHTGGDFTLTITIRQSDGSEESFTTAAIAYNAAAATIEGAIDTAATSASVTSWTNGDITVAAGATDLQDGNMTFTADGASVTERQVTFVEADSRTGGTSGANSVTAAGSLQRSAWSILLSYGIIESTIPEQDAAASLTTVTKGTGTETNLLPAVIVKQLMMEAAAEDVNNGAYFSLEKAVFPQDRSPLVETRLTGDAEVHDA